MSLATNHLGRILLDVPTLYSENFLKKHVGLNLRDPTQKDTWDWVIRKAKASNRSRLINFYLGTALIESRMGVNLLVNKSSACKAESAAGIFQFYASTAADYGLRPTDRCNRDLLWKAMVAYTDQSVSYMDKHFPKLDSVYVPLALWTFHNMGRKGGREVLNHLIHGSPISSLRIGRVENNLIDASRHAVIKDSSSLGVHPSVAKYAATYHGVYISMSYLLGTHQTKSVEVAEPAISPVLEPEVHAVADASQGVLITQDPTPEHQGLDVEPRQKYLVLKDTVVVKEYLSKTLLGVQDRGLFLETVTSTGRKIVWKLFHVGRYQSQANGLLVYPTSKHFHIFYSETGQMDKSDISYVLEELLKV